jgi:hypothetical protein
MQKNETIKIIFRLNFINDNILEIKICRIDSAIHDFMSPILYYTSSGYVFEKNVKFDIKENRCILPYKIKYKNKFDMIIKKFNNDSERKEFLLNFKKQLDEFTRSIVLSNKNNEKKNFYQVKFKRSYWLIY